MHLDTMLVLIIVDVQHMKPFLQFQLVNCLNINVQRTNRGVVLVHVGKGTSREVLVVWGTEDEHAFYIIGSRHVLIGPGCSRPTEIKSRMGTDECFDSFWMHLLLSPVYILRQFSTQLPSWISKELRLLVYHSPACRHCRDCFSIISHPIQVPSQAETIKMNEDKLFFRVVRAGSFYGIYFPVASCVCRRFAMIQS